MTWREVTRGVVLHGSTLRPRKNEASEFYPRRQTLLYPIIMKFVGLWDTLDLFFCIRA